MLYYLGDLFSSTTFSPLSLQKQNTTQENFNLSQFQVLINKFSIMKNNEKINRRFYRQKFCQNIKD